MVPARAARGEAPCCRSRRLPASPPRSPWHRRPESVPPTLPQGLPPPVPDLLAASPRPPPALAGAASPPPCQHRAPTPSPTAPAPPARPAVPASPPAAFLRRAASTPGAAQIHGADTLAPTSDLPQRGLPSPTHLPLAPAPPRPPARPDWSAAPGSFPA